MGAKIDWAGEVQGVQPRIRLTRSFDQRTHSYLGYVLRMHGHLDGEEREFVVAVGKGAHAKHGFRAGDRITGKGVPVRDRNVEIADIHRASAIRIVERRTETSPAAPPWVGVPAALEVYRARGHRRLAARTFASRCTTCLWGCEMAVEMIIDHWNPHRRKYRRETFCYGPKSCPHYKPGPTRKVPGRKGMSYEEEDWVDEEDTAHRSPDE